MFFILFLTLGDVKDTLYQAFVLEIRVSHLYLLGYVTLKCSFTHCVFFDLYRRAFHEQRAWHFTVECLLLLRSHSFTPENHFLKYLRLYSRYNLLWYFVSKTIQLFKPYDSKYFPRIIMYWIWYVIHFLLNLLYAFVYDLFLVNIINFMNRIR